MWAQVIQVPKREKTHVRERGSPVRAESPKLRPRRGAGKTHGALHGALSGLFPLCSVHLPEADGQPLRKGFMG